MKRSVCLRIAATTALLTAATAADAADTTETFDEGAADIEVYTGVDGLGLGQGAATFAGETVLGYGIVKRISAYARAAASANDLLEDGDGEAALGLFGTPVETDHFDIDLGVDVGWNPGSALITPGVELNLDAEPDLALAGVYLRGEEALVTRKEAAAEPPDGSPPGGEAETGTDETVLAPTTVLTLGTYWTMAEGHQLLLEADAGVAHRPAEDEETFDFGGVALGYNFEVHESVELISQVFLDVPIRDGEQVSTGVSIGLIGTAHILDAAEDDQGDAVARRAAPRKRAAGSLRR
ncbi:MAG: hypothetical protein JRI23_10530 [Deltaproteobacteria bacterium]|jgi:hypothetical protein|nr:hypothetical protein [Deltaproteobacteria bacterium]MBW2532111.1 hypothetical protein [Deltaproteobacteria bacterium]